MTCVGTHQHLGRPLWDAEPALRTIVRDTGSDLLIVDSILPSVGVGKERLRSDAQAPYLYVATLGALGIPTLSLGHPPKGQRRAIRSGRWHGWPPCD